MKRIKKIVVIPFAALVLLGGGAVAGYASMASAKNAINTSVEGKIIPGEAGFHINGKGKSFGKGFHRGMGPGVMGKVTAVNGSTITLTSPDGKTFTIDAGTATVQKIVTGTIADIAVGDNIGVQGDISTGSVKAKTIMDDLPAFPAKAQ